MSIKTRSYLRPLPIRRRVGAFAGLTNASSYKTKTKRGSLTRTAAALKIKQTIATKKTTDSSSSSSKSTSMIRKTFRRTSARLRSQKYSAIMPSKPVTRSMVATKVVPTTAVTSTTTTTTTQSNLKANTPTTADALIKALQSQCASSRVKGQKKHSCVACGFLKYYGGRTVRGANFCDPATISLTSYFRPNWGGALEAQVGSRWIKFANVSNWWVVQSESSPVIGCLPIGWTS